ncbi:MAG: hypothetical protein H0A76_08300 [Candidatus Thiodubiliella endoseptemdiera]|uniref:Type IV conjugative transfer system protein TraE n=1 Tax=Candidatus Thiodubiliella endoseptemdiera TaxID=2738886 RepID=A0A853F1V3_9GAMM|nr:hypothetical protein [Candidatus Thiodubiliella endoseptemdiera]
MNVTLLNKLKANLKDEKNLLRFALITVIIISMINYTSIQNIKNNERIVIVPLNQSSQFWVSANEASDLYLTNLGLYATQLWQNYTPANVEQNFAKLLEMVDVQHYPDIKKLLKNKVDLVKRYNRNSYSFRETKTQINTKTQKIIVTGVQTRWTKNGKKPAKKIQLIIGYQINNATFSITSLKEKKL